jgi:glycine C-acetyltransferase
MSELPYPLVSTDSPIVPILVGDEDAADALARSLGESGIHVDAVRFPAVPLRKARLRIQLNAGHTRQDIDGLIDTLRARQDRVDTALASIKGITDLERSESMGSAAV